MKRKNSFPLVFMDGIQKSAFQMVATVLGQIHSVLDMSEDAQSVLSSQYVILQRILLEQKKGSPRIFAEGVGENWNDSLRKIITPPDFERLPEIGRLRGYDGVNALLERNKVRTVFPAGLPKGDLTTWTDAQKEALTGWGAAKLLWQLDMLPTLYAAETVATNLDATKAKGDRQTVFVNREILALTLIIQEQRRDPNGGPIFLIYGADHSFPQYARTNLRISQEDLSR